MKFVCPIHCRHFELIKVNVRHWKPWVCFNWPNRGQKQTVVKRDGVLPPLFPKKIKMYWKKSQWTIFDILEFKLGTKAWGNKTKEMYYSLLTLKMISLVYSPKPHSQLWILIYRKLSIQPPHFKSLVSPPSPLGGTFCCPCDGIFISNSFYLFLKGEIFLFYIRLRGGFKQYFWLIKF